MKIIPVLCQRCGAPLDVADESVRFVTCAHCSTPLEIVREATQSHSKILEQIQAATEDHGRRLKVVELQNELERFDREWEGREVMIDGVLRSHEGRKDMVLLAVPVAMIALIMLGLGISNWDLATIILSVIPFFGAWFVFRGLQKTRRDLKVLEDLAMAHQVQRLQLVEAIESARREAQA
jgi:hypothetical protein